MGEFVPIRAASMFIIRANYLHRFTNNLIFVFDCFG